MLVTPQRATLAAAPVDKFVPTSVLSSYVKNQLTAMENVDSVTIDPHKSGYVQYPAGEGPLLVSITSSQSHRQSFV